MKPEKVLSAILTLGVVLLLFLATSIRPAHAAFPALIWNYDSTDYASSARGACEAARARLTPPGQTNYFTGFNGPFGTSPNLTADCLYSETEGGGAPYFNPVVNSAAASSCPQNSTGEASSCTCSAGYAEGTGGFAGSCVVAAGQCTAGEKYSTDGKARAPLGDWCIGGCVTWMYGRAGDGSPGGKYSYVGSKTGATCTGSAGVPPMATSTCGDGQCQGYVNGVTTCLPCGVPGTSTEKAAEKKTTNPDGTSSKETVTTTSAPGGGSPGGGGGGVPGGSTRTIITYDVNGNPTGTTTKEGAEVPENDFCSEHPDTFGCTNIGEPNVAPGPDLVTQERGPSTITPVFVPGSAGSCPADIALPKGMSFSFSALCTTAEGLRPVVLALAWLSAGLLVVGGFRDG